MKLIKWLSAAAFKTENDLNNSTIQPKYWWIIHQSIQFNKNYFNWLSAKWQTDYWLKIEQNSKEETRLKDTN